VQVQVQVQGLEREQEQALVLERELVPELEPRMLQLNQQSKPEPLLSL
jgi:hypothetical protein